LHIVQNRVANIIQRAYLSRRTDQELLALALNVAGANVIVVAVNGAYDILER
jgi:hypothetical protein